MSRQAWLITCFGHVHADVRACAFSDPFSPPSPLHVPWRRQHHANARYWPSAARLIRPRGHPLQGATTPCALVTGWTHASPAAPSGAQRAFIGPQGVLKGGLVRGRASGPPPFCPFAASDPTSPALLFPLGFPMGHGRKLSSSCSVEPRASPPRDKHPLKGTRPDGQAAQPRHHLAPTATSY